MGLGENPENDSYWRVCARSDYGCMVCFSSLAVCVAIMVIHVSQIRYRLLQRRIQLSTHTQSVLARVLVDQAIFAPGSIVGLYYLTELLRPSTGTIQKRLSAAQQSVESSFTQVLLRNYTLWPGKCIEIIHRNSMVPNLILYSGILSKLFLRFSSVSTTCFQHRRRILERLPIIYSEPGRAR